ncbi:MAG: putative DNA-binding protein [Clostridia bacterium]|nr:putative DNA-binding protein [Clostridia bacterium]
MEEKVRISILLELYGKLLTEKQYEFMDYYYNQDLSLSEIGDNNDITRQAVRTILLKSKKKLEEYESKLKFMQKEEKIKKYIEELEETNVDKKILKKIKQQIDF